MIAVIDYQAGNVLSIANMISRVGGKAIVTNDPAKIAKADKLVLPGVGHFDYGMNNLRSTGLSEALTDKVLHHKTPILGICLGVQLFTKRSEEGNEEGLGWIDAVTKKFDRSRLSAVLKVPHMAWSDVSVKKKSRLFVGFDASPRFYFVHSYHVVCANIADELVHCSYGYEFVAGIEHENILGVQFHPEKSHKFGMDLMRNFIENY